jgi:hypothetical protein
VSPPRTFDGVASRVNGTRPSLGGSHDDHRPPWLSDGFAGSCSSLDLLDLLKSPLHGSGHVIVDADVVLVVRAALGESSVLDDSDLVTVTSKQAGELDVR